jgi:hypothetical protein
MISIDDAVEQGITRLRKPIWANRCDRVELLMFDGKRGINVRLWAPFNKECNGRDPVLLPVFGEDAAEKTFVPYDGPLPDSAEYQAEVAQFEGVLKR